MPCYIDSMLSAYFQTGDRMFSHSQYTSSLTPQVIGNILYDFIGHIIQNFGPPSFNEHTRPSLEHQFVDWEMDVYCLITNEVDMQNQDEIEGEKYDNFWNIVENRSLNERYLTFESVERVFNNSPVTYQRHYIELLNYENNIGNDDADDTDDDDTQFHTSIDTAGTIEYVEGHLTDNYDSESESDVETDGETDVETDDDTDEETDDDTDEETDDDTDVDSMPDLISCSEESDDDDITVEEALDIISNFPTITSSQ